MELNKESQGVADIPLLKVHLWQKRKSNRIFFTIAIFFPFSLGLEDMARYMGRLLAPAESFGQGFFFVAHFRPFLVSSSNLDNF